MVQRIGNRRKTRSLYRKPVRTRGKVSLRKFFQSFKEGDRVRLVAESSLPGLAMPLFRFQGRVGQIAGMQGKCYLVNLNDRGKQKLLIVHPVHMQAVRK